MNTTMTAVTTILTALLSLATGYIGKGQAKTDRAVARAHARLDELPDAAASSPASTAVGIPLERELLAQLRKLAAPGMVAEAEAAAVRALTSPSTAGIPTR